MEQHPISELLKISLSNLENIIDANIIVGDVINLEDAKIIPISKVKCGFISGGFDQKKQIDHSDNYPFGGGTGGNVSVTPVAFLVYNQNKVELLHLDESNLIIDKIVELLTPKKTKNQTLLPKK